MTGKISQAAVLAAAAYRDEETFRRVTGITSSKLVIDKDERNTHVRSASQQFVHAWSRVLQALIYRSLVADLSAV